MAKQKISKATLWLAKQPGHATGYGASPVLAGRDAAKKAEQTRARAADVQSAWARAKESRAELEKVRESHARTVRALEAELRASNAEEWAMMAMAYFGTTDAERMLMLARQARIIPTEQECRAARVTEARAKKWAALLARHKQTTE